MLIHYCPVGGPSQVVSVLDKQLCLTDGTLLSEDFEAVKQFDREPQPFLQALAELEVTFPPTYPFLDGSDADAVKYGRKRAVAWPDRVMMSQRTRATLAPGRPLYEVIGGRSCMGDHKPVALSFQLMS